MRPNPAPPTSDRFAASRTLQERAHTLIPGGAHTYAKGDDQYPVDAPGFIVRGRGCHVWDVDGNEFIEYGMGLRAVTLGHGHPAVTDAAAAAMRDGLNFTRPSLLEVQAAEDVLAVLPWADMVKFAKNGSDVTTAAVKLARAWTGRDLVAICGDQPFFSVDDWFIGTTAMADGIPGVVRDLTVSFPYNDLAAVEMLFQRHPDEIACLVLEAATTIEPAPGFLEGLRSLCDRHGALLIFDEMITGFRWALGGSQAAYGVTPDLATFGKALANGHPLSALVGRRDVMEIGGLRHAHRRVFLLSTTHGAESAGLAAGRATIDTYRREGIVDLLYRQGERLRSGATQAAVAAGVSDHFQVIGRASNLIFVTLDADGARSQVMRTLFMQELIARGVLGPSFVVSAAHHDDDIDRTVDAIGEALHFYRRGLEGDATRLLRGRPVAPVFREFA